MEKPPLLYHGSPNKCLEVLEPRVSKGSGEQYGKLVYASPDIATSSVFLADVPGRWSLGAFGAVQYALIAVPRDKFIANDKGGSIYVLPSETFETDEHRGLGSKEWASEVPVRAIEKMDFSSALEAMLNYGVQVYFITSDQLDLFNTSLDYGLSILSSMESENERQNVNVRPLMPSGEPASTLSSDHFPSPTKCKSF
jgi:hypothetical protein